MKRSLLTLALPSLFVLLACSCTAPQQRHSQKTADSKSQTHQSLLGDFKFKSGAGPSDVLIMLTVSRTGHDIGVSFQAAHLDAHGASPDGEGTGRIGPDGVLRFNYEDSFYNRGSGIFRQTSRGYELLMTITEVAEPRCMMFYGDILLERVGRCR